jgi:lysophospholipid acyltransferase (LPLAT)-like uncharacterized protein
MLWQSFLKGSKIPADPFVAEESHHMTIDLGRKDDGRWIAEILESPGVLVYAGATQDEAISKVTALASRVLDGLLAKITKDTLHGEVDTGPCQGQEI